MDRVTSIDVEKIIKNNVVFSRQELADSVGNIDIAAEMKEMEKDYIVSNLGFNTLPENKLARDPEREQFELNTNSATTQALSNGPQLSAYLHNRTNVTPDDLYDILFPSQDVVSNYVQFVLDSEANLSKEILSLPVAEINSLNTVTLDSDTKENQSVVRFPQNNAKTN